MAKQFDYRLLIKVGTNNAFTLTTVLSAPRQCLPADVLAACQNITLEAENSETPRHFSIFATYVISEYFALAHRTGLYNRQRGLWEAIGRVVEVRVKRPQFGIFNKVNAPFVDFSCLDSKGQTLIFASLLDEVGSESKYETDSGLKKYVEEAIKRAGKEKKRGAPLAGIFLGLPNPMPKTVLDMVARQTGASDPVARYESMLPDPLSVPLNLIGFSWIGDGSGRMRVQFSHPQLKGFSEASTLVEVS